MMMFKFQLRPSRSPTGTQSRLGSLRLILRATNPHEPIKLRFITFSLRFKLVSIVLSPPSGGSFSVPRP